MDWITAETDPDFSKSLSERLGVSKVAAELLVLAGINSVEAAEEFLRPKLSLLDNPFAITNLEAAVIRIEAAIEGEQSVVVFGDYDVDGVTSTVQLVSMLRTLGLEPKYCVPRRLEEGYGLSQDAIDRVFDGARPDLFIALDCGTNAHEEIAYIRAQGVDVIVVDHHQAKVMPPKDCVFVNPHVNDLESAAWRDLCTAGLVFKLLHGLLKRRRAAEDPRVESIKLKDYLDLVAMGTIADLVPLHNENRILSWYGLRHLRANGRVGVRALAEVSGIDSSKEMVSSDISFRLGPRINASGRLADAALPIRLLLSDDYAECMEISKELEAMNRERQTIERAITEEAERCVVKEFSDKPGIVLFGADWHPGVVGIVASRVSRQFHKPCVVMGAEGDLAKGSGRSVSGVNLVEIFQDCSELLGHWGGHPMAAGVSMSAANVPEFTARFIESMEKAYPDGLPEANVSISSWLELPELNERLLEELDRLHPFGQGNTEPIFGLKSVQLDAVQAFGKGHSRFRLDSVGGARGVSGIAWGYAELPQHRVDIAVRFSWNYWRNNRYPQVTLVDWRASESGA
jgi:single-stranded-DNA-specific exonuclease